MKRKRIKRNKAQLLNKITNMPLSSLTLKVAALKKISFYFFKFVILCWMDEITLQIGVVVKFVVAVLVNIKQTISYITKFIFKLIFFLTSEYNDIYPGTWYVPPKNVYSIRLHLIGIRFWLRVCTHNHIFKFDIFRTSVMNLLLQTSFRVVKLANY